MSGRTILVVALALACGLAAFVGISMMGQGGPAATPTRPVAFAVAEIRRGAPIQKEMIEIRRVVEASMPPAALGKPEDVLGRIAAMKMIPGDAVTDAKLEPKGAKSRVVPPGKLAFTVARADMPPLEVDDHVDVYFTANGQAPAIAPLQDIPVWDLVTGDGKPGSAVTQGPATLLVDPAQAGALNQGMNQGTLRLVRRNPNDPARVVAPPPPPKPSEASEFAAVIAPGMRAYALETSAASVTVGGNLRAGDRVDALLTRKGSAGQAQSRTLANVVVLAARGGTSPVEGQSVILMVAPDDAALLDRAQSEGTVHLSLRKPDDLCVPTPPAARAAAALGADVNPGMRAFMFEATNASVTLGGRVRPGDHVDVLMIVKSPKGSGGMIGKTLANVEVLGHPGGDESPGGDKQPVTLLVTPEEAATLALAQATGTLHLSLRKPGDIDIPVPPATLEAEALARSIAPGRRAYVLEVAGPSASLCETVRPGDHLDVLLLGKKQGDGDSAGPRTLANVEVYRVQPANDTTPNEKPLLTLLVTPDEAEALAQGQADGTIQLSLRKPGDLDVPDRPLVEAEPDARPYREVTRTTITLRGTSVGADRLIVRLPTPRAGGPPPRTNPTRSAPTVERSAR